jgi:hypothetical protein
MNAQQDAWCGVKQNAKKFYKQMQDLKFSRR